MTNDAPEQASRALEAVSGANELVITPTALCEVAWVLRSVYRRSAPEVAAAIEGLLTLRAIRTDRDAIMLGLHFLRSGADFADGVIVSQGRRLGAERLLSFDTRAVKLARAAGLDAEQP